MVVKILLISFMKRLKRMRLRLQPCLRPILENKNSVIPLGSRMPSLVLYYMFSKFNKATTCLSLLPKQICQY